MSHEQLSKKSDKFAISSSNICWMHEDICFAFTRKHKPHQRGIPLW